MMALVLQYEQGESSQFTSCILKEGSTNCIEDGC